MKTIKNVVEEIFNDNVDGVSFIPGDADGNLDIRGFVYNKKTKYVEHSIGTDFHILLYRCNADGLVFDIDLFDAILTGPDVYITNIIKSGFFGIVLKKTKGTHSKKFINGLMEKLKKYSV
jgi:hypothetical protein